MLNSDETVTLTCMCGCGSIRFDYFKFEDGDTDLCVTPYAIMGHPFHVPRGIWGRIKTAWWVLCGSHPEPVMIIEPEEKDELMKFLQKIEKERKI